MNLKYLLKWSFLSYLHQVDGNISKQRVVVDEDAVTVFTKDGSKEFIKPVAK